MHCNSAGKSILSLFSDAEVEAIVDRHGLPARTENTITDRETLFEEIEQIREQGYALNLGEDLEGIHAVGVPLVFEGEVKGALSIAGPAHCMGRDRCETELVDRLFAARNEVELNLAYT
jgi:DNA-binding IclR family transcriptional regulator